MRRKEIDVDIAPRHKPTDYVKAYGMAGLFVLAFLFLVFSPVMVKLFSGSPLPFGDFLNATVNMWGIELLTLLGIAVLTAWFLAVRWMKQGNFIPVNESGGYWRNHKGVFTPLPPLAVTVPSVTVTEQQSSIPRLSSLIHAGSLSQQTADGVLMFQGFKRNGTMRYGRSPGVIGVAGAQNVGKSVTIANLAVMFAMQHAYVVVNDTHHMKTRSLYRKLEAMEEHITFAKTEEQVLEQAELFSNELASRKHGSNPYPYVFILDEAASILKRSDVGGMVMQVIEQCGQEGQGFNMTIILGIHDFSKDGLGGDIRIREYLNFIYAHRMAEGQSKFIPAFNEIEIKAQIASLPEGHAMVKDELNKVEYLVMPFADSSDILVARNQLARLQVPQSIAGTVLSATDDLEEDLPPLIVKE